MNSEISDGVVVDLLGVVAGAGGNATFGVATGVVFGEVGRLT